MEYKAVKDVIHISMIEQDISWEALAGRISWETGRSNLFKAIMYGEPRWNLVMKVLSALNIQMRLK